MNGASFDASVFKESASVYLPLYGCPMQRRRRLNAAAVGRSSAQAPTSSVGRRSVAKEREEKTHSPPLIKVNVCCCCDCGRRAADEEWILSWSCVRPAGGKLVVEVTAGGQLYGDKKLQKRSIDWRS